MQRLLAVAIAASATACHPTVSFDIEQLAETQIPGSVVVGTPLGALNFPAFSSMSFSQNSTFASNNTAKDRVRECRLSRVTLKVTSPTGGTLGFLRQIDFNIDASGLGPRHIAGLSPVPDVSQVDLVVDPVDLAPYVRADSFSITSSGSGTAPQQNTTIDATIVLHVTAELF